MPIALRGMPRFWGAWCHTIRHQANKAETQASLPCHGHNMHHFMPRWARQRDEDSAFSCAAYFSFATRTGQGPQEAATIKRHDMRAHIFFISTSSKCPGFGFTQIPSHVTGSHGRARAAFDANASFTSPPPMRAHGKYLRRHAYRTSRCTAAWYLAEHDLMPRACLDWAISLTPTFL